MDILVENSGRVNFTRAIRTERKGIRPPVTLAGITLTGWQMYSLPMEDVSGIHFRKADLKATVPATGPTFYQGSFSLQTPGDSFLDMRTMKKGVVWVNDHLLGRFWDIGPQRTLYLPAPWLKPGKNIVVVFDMIGQPGSKLSGLGSPILDGEVPQNSGWDLEVAERIWRPRRDLNPCYRRESLDRTRSSNARLRIRMHRNES